MRPEKRVEDEGRFKMCRKCKGSGRTRHSPSCPGCAGKGHVPTR